MATLGVFYLILYNFSSGKAPCPIVTGGCGFRNAESVVYNAGLWCKTEAGHHQEMVKGLIERLQDGDTIIVAEGYLREMERRGFLQFGPNIPEVVLDRPSAVRELHEEFALAGSDVMVAFTYYAHREKLRSIGREDDLEKLNRQALKIARDVADEHGLLMAGNISNTPLYRPNDPGNDRKITEMFKEQIIWAVEEGADYIIGETFNSYGEATLALQAVLQYGKGLPAVITLTAYFPDHTTDDISLPVACKRLQDQGACVVGLNCARGPNTTLPLAKELRKTCSVPVAVVPVPFRTTEKYKTHYSLTDPVSGERIYPDLDCVRCNRADVRKFTREAKAAGIQYIGLCCGNVASLVREVAEELGRQPPASKFSEDLSKSFIFSKKAEGYGEEMLKLRRFMLGDL